jgi:hypothetical protein
MKRPTKTPTKLAIRLKTRIFAMELRVTVSAISNLMGSSIITGIISIKVAMAEPRSKEAYIQTRADFESITRTPIMRLAAKEMMRVYPTPTLQIKPRI